MDDRPSPGRTRPDRRRTTPIALLLSAALLVATALMGDAGAQSVEDAEAEAQAIAADLAAARERLIELAEEYNRAGADLAAAQAEVAANQAIMADQETKLAQARQRMQDYAVQAYVAGGPMQDLDGFFGADATTADRRLNYIDVASGDEEALLDQLASAQQRVTGQLDRLRVAEAAARAEKERLDRSQHEAAELEARTSELLDEANGRLATLVAEAEARRAEEEAAAAAEAARQAGARAPQPAADDATVAVAAAPAGAPPPAAPAYTPPPGIRPEAAVALSAAMSQLGVPYVWGGSSPSQGFDCSGLMYWAYAQAGIRISRPADYQRDDAIRISYEDLQPGDLVFYGEPPSHVGMYVGGDQIINAPQTGDVVSVKTMWYSRKPMTYGRIG
jgi:cell wall-associated NlpC family hydrolase